MKIVTFNARIAVKADGENYFFNRLPLIVKKMNEAKPDIVGFQEVSSEMRKSLIDALPDYVFVGGGRDKDRHGESACVAYRREKFIPAEIHTFWLSETPTVPGSRYPEDQSGCPRVCSMVLLTPLDKSPSFRVYNLHTDHVGKIARLRASYQLLEEVNRDREVADLPFFIMGDLNARPDSPEITALRESTSPKLTDLTDNLSGVSTYHGYGKVTGNTSKIDYLFASEGIEASPAALWEDREGDVWLSDHYPVEVEATVL